MQSRERKLMNKPSYGTILLSAIRPKTLGAAVAPVLIGTALAYADQGVHWLYAVLALLGAIWIQIGTNLANDYYDFLQGADTEERKGPTRVTQAGWLTPTQVKWGFIGSFGISALIGIPLMFRGGWPILVVGLASIASGILYTKGKHSLGYIGLGDIFVLIFFGPVAVGGTYYLQTLSFSTLVLILGLAPGWIATGILAVNNLRDVEQDKKANKKTLAVRWGRTFARCEYTVCLLLPALLPIWAWLTYGRAPYAMFSALFLVPAWPTLQAVWTETDGPVLNQALARTGQLLLLYSILFSIGWVL